MSWPAPSHERATPAPRTLLEALMDARTRRTRGKLHTAILGLATEWPVTQLSMTEVAAAAGVHRSTLYVHASSPVELLQQALLVELDEIRERVYAEAPADTVGAVARATQAVLEHVERYADIYRRSLGGEGTEAGLEGMLDRHIKATSDELRRIGTVVVDLHVPGLDPEVVADAAHHFLAHGTTGVIASWLRWPGATVADFLDAYAALLPGWWPTAGTPQPVS